MANTAFGLELPSSLQSRLGWRHSLMPEAIPAGVGAIDLHAGGWPRGRIAEIVGGASSGRTTLLHSLLAEGTSLGEICAVVDAMDCFDPSTATLNGVHLDRLIWIQCGGNLEHAMKATDLLLHSGGLGVVALDLCDVPTNPLSRLPSPYWFRFRRAVETSQTVCAVFAERPVAKSCSSLMVHTDAKEPLFTERIFRESTYQVQMRKPYGARGSALRAVWNWKS